MYDYILDHEDIISQYSTFDFSNERCFDKSALDRVARNENNGSGILIFDNEWTISFWENPHFLGQKIFCLAFLLADLEFSFLPLKYFIYFKHKSFCSRIMAKVYAGEKADFPSFTIFFFHLQSFYV